MNGALPRRLRPGRIASWIAPVLIVPLAGLSARTPIAVAWPRTALFLLAWAIADTMMLALVARSPGRRPAASAVLATLASASLAFCLMLPPVLRQALAAMPAAMAGIAIPVLLHLAVATRRGVGLWRAPHDDGAARWRAVAGAFLPPALVRFAAMELTVMHMALFRWGGPADVPGDARAFAYHRHLTPICTTLLVMSAIEAAVYHLLVGHWSRTTALVLFVLSDVGLVWLVGLIKSFRFRPVLLTPAGVRVRAGILIDRAIPLAAIAGVETDFTGDTIRDPATLNAALLAWPNIVLRLNTPIPRRALLRTRPPVTRIAFRLDDPEPFVRLLRWRLGQP